MNPGPGEILVFRIGGRRYGLPVGCVRELVRAVATAPLPSAPGVVEGVIDVRGRVVPVLDLRARLGLPAKAVEPDDLLILAETRGTLVALRVDGADGLRKPAGAGPGGAGVAPLGDGLAPVLDPGGLLSGPEFEALGAALRGPSS